MKRGAETAFLPAALEVEATPPSPAGRAILWAILVVFAFGCAWATYGQVDIVAVAQGRVIPNGHSKTVQPLEIGTVTAIHVAEGQAVEKDELLIALDDSRARADIERLSEELSLAEASVARYRRLGAWLEGENSSKPENFAINLDPLLVRTWREFEDRLRVLAGERDRRLAEQRSARFQVEKLRLILPIVSRRAKDQQGLAERKLLPEQQYLETEQERLEVEHELASKRSRLDELEAAIRELEMRAELARSEFYREVLERAGLAARERMAAETELAKARSNLNARKIKAPVAGIVQQLAVRNTGAVVTPAQELMVIVPQDRAIEVEALLENKDIGFVHVGQSAEIKIDAFPFTRYGTIAGEVIDLSNDAVADEQRGLVYKMRVRMNSAEIQVQEKLLSLTPGMTVTVESRTGSRRLIEFFLSPLLRYADESVRER